MTKIPAQGGRASSCRHSKTKRSKVKIPLPGGKTLTVYSVKCQNTDCNKFIGYVDKDGKPYYGGK